MQERSAENANPAQDRNSISDYFGRLCLLIASNPGQHFELFSRPVHGYVDRVS